MADNAQIYQGGNRLFTLAITDENGTALNRTALASAAIELWFDGVKVATYTYGTDTQFRAGTAANEFTLEITSAFTTALASSGTLTGRLLLSVTDADFDVEPDAFKDIIVTDLADII